MLGAATIILGKPVPAREQLAGESIGCSLLSGTAHSSHTLSKSGTQGPAGPALEPHGPLQRVCGSQAELRKTLPALVLTSVNFPSGDVRGTAENRPSLQVADVPKNHNADTTRY